MQKIDILGLHLNYGGTEQAIINQANMLCDNFDVRLVVTYKMIKEPAFHLDQRVKVIYLTSLKPNRETFKSALKSKNPIKIAKESLTALKVLYTKTQTMKNYIKSSNADVIISSRLSTHKLVKKYAKSAVKIAEEHRYSLDDKPYLKKIQKSCQKFDYFVCVSQNIANFYQKILPNVKCVFIPNALCENATKNIANYQSKNILSIGRLSKEKGFDDAIRIMHLLTQKDKNIKLNIVGEGPERNNLEAEIAKYHLEQNIILHGFQNQAYIKKLASTSSLYLLTSHEESFGTAVIEAASYGIPTITFSSAKGPLEIIKNQENGVIISGRSLATMANTILMLFSTPETLTKLGENAFLTSKKYSFNNAKAQWMSLISTALEKNSHLL